MMSNLLVTIFACIFSLVLLFVSKSIKPNNKNIQFLSQNKFLLVDDGDDDVVEPLKILKAQSTLKLIARDWSAECAIEREQSYKPIIDSIEEYYKPTD